MSRKWFALQSALMVAGALVLATAAHAKTVTLGWTHPDVSGDEVLGFRLYQRDPAGSWEAPIQLLLTSLTSSPGGIYQYDLEVDPTTDVIVAAAAFNGQGESLKSNEQMVLADEVEIVPPPEPGSEVLATFSFDAAVGEPGGWLDTGANNGLTETDSLFRMGTVDSQGVLMTDSTSMNIHSHVLANDLSEWVDYEYTGRMRTSTSNDGIGVTAYSQYPDSDAYYRVRSRNSSDPFHLSNHSVSGITCSTTDTGVLPAAGSWYSFKIRLQTLPTQTLLQASVWSEGSPEPANWQLDCYDDSAGRLTRGTVGVWSMGSGEKYWDDLEVVLLEAPSSVPELPVLLPQP